MARIFISNKRADKDKVFKIKDQIECTLELASQTASQEKMLKSVSNHTTYNHTQLHQRI